MNLEKIEGSPSLEVVNLVLEKKARGEKVVSLAIGDPSLGTPKEIIEVAYETMKSGDVHYVSSYGTLDVREAIKNKVRRKNAISAEIENCLFLTTKFTVYAALVASSEQEFDALIPDPGYFYSEPVLLAGGKPIRYSLASDFSLDLDNIRKKVTPKTKVIVINSPSNPTSKVFLKSELTELYELCNDKSIHIISDEAYEDLIYEGKHFSIGSIEAEPDLVTSIFSLSKSYCMTGWRAGYVVSSKNMIYLMNKFIEHTLTCLPPFIERASAFALNNCDDFTVSMREKFRKRRDYFVERLERIEGLECNRVEGAFYAFPKYKKNLGSIEVSKSILQEQGVAVLPGIAFGEKGENRIRLSFSGETREIEDGLSRLENYF